MRAASVLFVAALAGCGVDRDLDPSRFACGFGGPCDGGVGATDAGDTGLAACAGNLWGESFDLSMPASPLAGSVSGVLVASGGLSLEFTSTRYWQGLSVVVQVEPSGAIVQSGAGTVSVSGTFDVIRCRASGTWSDAQDSAQWNLELEE